MIFEWCFFSFFKHDSTGSHSLSFYDSDILLNFFFGVSGRNLVRQDCNSNELLTFDGISLKIDDFITN